MANNDTNGGTGPSQGTSYLYDYGTSPNTRVAVSQKVRLLAPNYSTGSSVVKRQMGVVSSFSPNSSRSVEPVRGIGYGDRIAELVPGVTDPETASFERALCYLSNLWQATGYASGVDGPVRSLRHHRWPFDVEQQIVFSTLVDMDSGVGNIGKSGDGFESGSSKRIDFEKLRFDANSPQNPVSSGHTAVITIYEACWFTSWSATISQDQGTIMESGEVMVTDVHDLSNKYGEFIATGNDPSIGQLGSMRYGVTGIKIPTTARS